MISKNNNIGLFRKIDGFLFPVLNVAQEEKIIGGAWNG